MRKQNSRSADAHRQVFTLKSKAKNVSAHGEYLSADPASDKFTVFGGARAALEPTATMPKRYLDLRTELIETHKLIRRNDFFELTDDYTFSAPSPAASVLLGRSESGHKAWKTQSNQSLGNWREERRNQDSPPLSDSTPQAQQPRRGDTDTHPPPAVADVTQVQTPDEPLSQSPDRIRNDNRGDSGSSGIRSLDE